MTFVEKINMESNDAPRSLREIGKKEGWYKDRRVGTRSAVVMLAMVTTLTGCAGSTAHARVHISHVERSALSPGSGILAKESWRHGGGRFLIVVESRSRHDEIEPEINTYEEDYGDHGIFPSGGGLLAAPAEDAVLTMNIERSCKALSVQALAYGLLRDRRDTVSARELNGRIVLRKVIIPAQFSAGGVLVYAQVGGGPTHVITRAPNGQITSRKIYGQKPFACR